MGRGMTKEERVEKDRELIQAVIDNYKAFVNGEKVKICNLLHCAFCIDVGRSWGKGDCNECVLVRNFGKTCFKMESVRLIMGMRGHADAYLDLIKHRVEVLEGYKDELNKIGGRLE